MKTNQIYQGDCLKIIKNFSNNCIDLTITSPPYDNLRLYKGYTFNFKGIAQQLWRITKEGGVIVWVVGDATINGSETGTSFKQALYFMECGFKLHDTMIYEKTGCSMPSHNRYLASFEYMFILSKGKPKTYNLIQDRKNKYLTRWGKGRKVRNKDGDWSYRNNYRRAKEYGTRFNIWRYSSGYGYGHDDSIAYQHPATFPSKLAQDHILSWSNKNDLILDPMCGSGTTCKMARENNRNFIGIEISKEYCKIANQRIKNAQLNLF